MTQWQVDEAEDAHEVYDVGPLPPVDRRCAVCNVGPLREGYSIADGETYRCMGHPPEGANDEVDEEDPDESGYTQGRYIMHMTWEEEEGE